MLKPKALSLALTLALCPALFLTGCGKAPSAAAGESPSRPAPHAGRSGGKGAGDAILSKEEVAAVLGRPVTSIEGTGTDLTYKTDAVLLEAGINVERQDDAADAVQSMQGARKATGFLGGKPEAVPGLGDEAFFGAMSLLYVRKGASFVTITPPNLQQQAQMKAYDKVTEAKLGSEEQVKALEDLKQVSKGDPTNAGLASPDAAQGAVAVIQASSKKQGTEYEAKARGMALALAAKLMQRL